MPLHDQECLFSAVPVSPLFRAPQTKLQAVLVIHPSWGSGFFINTKFQPQTQIFHPSLSWSQLFFFKVLSLSAESLEKIQGLACFLCFLQKENKIFSWMSLTQPQLFFSDHCRRHYSAVPFLALSSLNIL